MYEDFGATSPEPGDTDKQFVLCDKPRAVYSEVKKLPRKDDQGESLADEAGFVIVDNSVYGP